MKKAIGTVLASALAMGAIAEAGVTPAQVKQAASQVGLTLGIENAEGLGFVSPTGERFIVSYANRNASGETTGLMVLSWFENPNGLSPSAFNAWNNQALVQGFLDTDGDGQLNMPIFTEGATSVDSLAQALSIYATHNHEFRKMMFNANTLSNSISLSLEGDGNRTADKGMSVAEITARDASLAEKLNGSHLGTGAAVDAAADTVSVRTSFGRKDIPRTLKDWAN